MHAYNCAVYKSLFSTSLKTTDPPPYVTGGITVYGGFFSLHTHTDGDVFIIRHSPVVSCNPNDIWWLHFVRCSQKGFLLCCSSKQLFVKVYLLFWQSILKLGNH